MAQLWVIYGSVYVPDDTCPDHHIGKHNTRITIRLMYRMASYGLGSLLSIDDLLWCASNVGKDDSIWIPETWGMECFGIMSAVAHQSNCRKIGSSILNVYSRSPATLAMGAVTMDVISKGRFVLGLGVSSPKIVRGLHGQAYHKPLQRMRESIQIIRKALSDKKINHSGKIYDTGGFSLLVSGYSDNIPLYVAAVNQKMVDLAWEMADGVIFYLRPPDELQNTINTMQQKRRIETVCQIITAVSDDAEAAYGRARRTLAFYISVGDIYREFLARHGYRTITDRIYNEYKNSGLKHIDRLIPDDMLHALTACGTPDECKSAIESVRRAGVTEPVMQFNPVGDVRESFKLLAKIR